MKKYLLVGYPPCSTCKKAENFMKTHETDFEYRNIKEERPNADEIREWQSKSGLPLKRFFNTSGMIYRELELKDKLPEMSEEAQIELLAGNGMLVRRPLLIAEDRVLVGFKESEWTEVLQK